MDEIILKNIRLKGRHGCFAHEMENPSDFVVSLRMFLDTSRAAKTDALDDTIDYPAAISAVQEIVEGDSVRLIEKLAQKIAAALFRRFDLLEELEVKVEKCTQEIDWVVSEIAVKIRRKREDF